MPRKRNYSIELHAKNGKVLHFSTEDGCSRDEALVAAGVYAHQHGYEWAKVVSVTPSPFVNDFYDRTVSDDRAQALSEDGLPS